MSRNICDVIWTNQVWTSQKVVGRWQVGGVLQVPLGPLLGICSLSVLESCMRHCLCPIFIYGSETILWKEKERSRNTGVQMEKLRGLLGIRRMDRVPNVRIRELCKVTKGLDERTD